MIPKRFMADKNYSNFEPVTVFNYSVFRELCVNNEGLQEDLDALHNHFIEVNKYRWGNTHFRFSNIFGHEFAFQIYNKVIHVWDAYGHTALGTFSLSGDANETVNEILKVSEEWSKGNKRCSDCGNWMNYQENSKHRYFAGVYCLDCWERKWKAVEAKENYE